MKRSREEWIVAFQDLIDSAPEGDPELLAQLYTPDTRISAVLSQIEEHFQKSKPTDAEQRRAGKLMEQLAFLVFRSISGAGVPKSYQSAGPQIDLEVSGDDKAWSVFLRALGLASERRVVLVEAKATRAKVDDATFARMTALVSDRPKTAGMGVFLTAKGASGFDVGSRGLRDARLRQVLYYARHEVPVLVLDINDLRCLATPGALPKILYDKLRSLESLAITPTDSTESAAVELPRHLQELLPST